MPTTTTQTTTTTTAMYRSVLSLTEMIKNIFSSTVEVNNDGNTESTMKISHCSYHKQENHG